jgi:hypothetical protein
MANHTPAPVAIKCGVPVETNVFAIPLIHCADGLYVGFDDSAPTARTGGKRVVAQRVKDSVELSGRPAYPHLPARATHMRTVC